MPSSKGSSSSKSSSSSSGIEVVGLLGVLLGVAFVTLKLTEVITWSWWWVTLPFWGGFALFGVVALVGLLMTFVGFLLGVLAEKKGI